MGKCLRRADKKKKKLDSVCLIGIYIDFRSCLNIFICLYTYLHSFLHNKASRYVYIFRLFWCFVLCSRCVCLTICRATPRVTLSSRLARRCSWFLISHYADLITRHNKIIKKHQRNCKSKRKIKYTRDTFV